MSGVSSTLSSLDNASSTTSLSNSNTTSANAALSFDSNEWLTLLTTELQNQDPTSPSDPTQFVAQLAQFSAVSQQVTTNSTLSSISSQISANSLGQSVGMIGKTVSGNASTYVVGSSGTAPDSNYNYAVSDSTLTNVHLQVKDSNGSVVSQAAVSGTSGSVSFSGTSSSGSALPAGTYSLSLVGTNTSGSTVSAGTLSSSGTVTAVLQNNGTTELQLDDGSTVDASSVTELSGS